ncbi:helix-turn-helix domain-containing protein [Psychrobacillus sp. NPDC093180]|uniref:helix-turn-helix domain-containing protein n=1 Tax=Psychrobacillus sp. NPDC093180 TaxID=3364489 RepID=UPI0037FE8954
MSKHFLSISIVLLSIAIFFLAFQLGNSVSMEAKKPVQIVGSSAKGLLTLEEAASYLNINKEKLTSIIQKQDSSREVLSSFDTYEYIPYIQIGEEKYFNQEQIDEWIRYNTVIWKEVE